MVKGYDSDLEKVVYKDPSVGPRASGRLITPSRMTSWKHRSFVLSVALILSSPPCHSEPKAKNPLIEYIPEGSFGQSL